MKLKILFPLKYVRIISSVYLLLIFLDTYNVQDLNLKTNRSYTEMKCLYCMPKVNQSCCVKFSDIAQGVEENFVVSGLDEKIVTLKRNGNYTVTTYDLVNGSCIGPAIEPIQVVINYNSTISSATSSLG